MKGSLGVGGSGGAVFELQDMSRDRHGRLSDRGIERQTNQNSNFRCPFDTLTGAFFINPPLGPGKYARGGVQKFHQIFPEDATIPKDGQAKNFLSGGGHHFPPSSFLKIGGACRPPNPPAKRGRAPCNTGGLRPPDPLQYRKAALPGPPARRGGCGPLAKPRGSTPWTPW